MTGTFSAVTSFSCRYQAISCERESFTADTACMSQMQECRNDAIDTAGRGSVLAKIQIVSERHVYAKNCLRLKQRKVDR